MRDPWFRPKRAGIGWTPCSWQGWLATALLIGAILGSTRILGRTPEAVGVAIAAGLAYIAVVLLTRTRPGDPLHD